MQSRILRLPFAVLLAALLLSAQALATWSIVIVNKRTGEVCVASATCLSNFNLRKATPVVIPGVGVAAAQSYLDSIGNRLVIHNQMLQGTSPDDILAILADRDNFLRGRQYGMVDLEGRALTFTGSIAGAWAGGVTGEVGDLVYAIQGNVLTGQPVVDDAEAAILNTPGDLAEKVMAAMEAAHLAGGDGRCSCSQSNPEGCGAPPPNFSHSAYCAYFLVARPGDPKKECDMNLGCGRGAYFLTINIKNLDQNDPEPIGLMRAEYDAWRVSKQGLADSVESLVIAHGRELQAGGSTNTIRYDVELYDLDGVPLTQGGATLTLEHQDGSLGAASIGQVTDHQDGSYTVEVDFDVAAPGVDRFHFRVDDGVNAYRPLLWPAQEVRITPRAIGPIGSVEAPAAGLPQYEIRDAHGWPSGVYSLAAQQAGGPLELLWSERSQGGYLPPQSVDVEGFAAWAMRSIWVSQDGLRMHFSAVDPADGIERIYRSERALTSLPFEEAVACHGLNSDLGESDPWLSSNELEVYFTTKRNGIAEVMRARRRAPDAVWWQAEVVAGLQSPAREPTLMDGDQRLAYQHLPGAATLRVAERQSDDSWLDRGGMPRAFAGLTRLVGVAQDYATANAEPYLLLRPTLAGLGFHQALPGEEQLQAQQDSVSATAGGPLQYRVQGPSTFALAPYELILGGPTYGAVELGLTLPVSALKVTKEVRMLAGSGPFTDLIGQLDASAAADLLIPLPAGFANRPELVGRTLGICVVMQQGNQFAITNPRPLHIEP